jgi:hypothetical protein
MIVSIGKSFLFGIVFDAEALLEEERAAGRDPQGFPGSVSGRSRLGGR